VKRYVVVDVSPIFFFYIVAEREGFQAKISRMNEIHLLKMGQKTPENYGDRWRAETKSKL